MTTADLPDGFLSVLFIHFLSVKVGLGQKKTLLMVRRAFDMFNMIKLCI
jgi:hypothetical protein